MPTGHLSVRYVGMIPMFTIMAMQAMLQAVGEVRFAMWVLIGSIILNAALDPVLIFGVGPVRQEGSGRGRRHRDLSNCSASSDFPPPVDRRSALHLRVHNFRPDFAQIKLAIRSRIPASIEQAIRTLRLAVADALAASFGTAASVLRLWVKRLMFFWFAPTMGLASRPRRGRTKYRRRATRPRGSGGAHGAWLRSGRSH